MKLNGKMFRHPMDNNRLDIVTSDKGSFVIFNTTDGANIAYQAKYQVDGIVENMEFQLSKQDYTTLSKLGEFDIAIDGPTLIVKAERFSAKFTKFDGVKLKLPDSKPQQLGINLSDIYEAAKFVSDKHINVMYHGVIISPDAIIGTDSYVMYRKEVNTNISKAISVPPLILKYLDKDKTYRCFLFGGKQICFVSGEEAFFSNLYEGDYKDMAALFKRGGQVISCSRAELMKSLAECAMFASIVVLSASQDQTLKIENLENEKGSKYTASIECEEFQGIYKLNIGMLQQVISISQDEQIDIHVGNNRALVEYQNIKSLVTETQATRDGKKAGGK